MQWSALILVKVQCQHTFTALEALLSQKDLIQLQYKPGLPILAPALEKYNQRSHGIGPGCLQLAEYRDLILKLTESYPMTTIIIDALDECNPATRYDLLDALDHIQNESTNLVKVFVSSRDERDLASRLKHFSNIDTAAAENV